MQRERNDQCTVKMNNKRTVSIAATIITVQVSDTTGDAIYSFAG